MQGQSLFLKLYRGKILRQGNYVYTGSSKFKTTTLNQFCKNSTVMGDLKGAPAVHFNFPLQSVSLCLIFKNGIAASGEPIPSE